MKNAVVCPETARVAIMQSAPNPAGGILNLIGATRGKRCEESRLVCWRFSQNCLFSTLQELLAPFQIVSFPEAPVFLSPSGLSTTRLGLFISASGLGKIFCFVYFDFPVPHQNIPEKFHIWFLSGNGEIDIVLSGKDCKLFGVDIPCGKQEQVELTCVFF